jgi:hypothetical protein
VPTDMATQGVYFAQALAGQPWLTVDEVRFITAKLPPLAEATPARQPPQLNADRPLRSVS